MVGKVTKRLMLGQLLLFLLTVLLPGQVFASQGEGGDSVLDSPVAVQGEVKAPEGAPVDLYYFWRDLCPVCSKVSVWLTRHEQEIPSLNVHRVEVAESVEGRALFEKMMGERGQDILGVPVVIIEDRVWVGFSGPIAEDIEKEITTRVAGEKRDESDKDESMLDMGILGTYDLGEQSLLSATFFIALLDGINPCSLWVLSILLGMVLGTRSRRRIMAVGVTFLIVTAMVYGTFMAGIFAAMQIIDNLVWIRWGVGLLALIVGGVNIKDYFAFKQGFSLTIPDRFKPKIYRSGRKVRTTRSLFSTLMVTIGLAAGVAFLELPCTAGFPVMWTTLINNAGIKGFQYAAYLGFYLVIYLILPMGILSLVIVTLQHKKFEETHGRVLKLVGGVVMLALAGALVFNPAVMESFTGSLLVIGAALGGSGLIMLIEKVWKKYSKDAPAEKIPKGTPKGAPKK